MLQAIRDRTRGWIAYVIVALLVIPFALFGMYNYLAEGGGAQTVATVNGEEITRTRLDQAHRQRQAQLREALGDRFDPAMFDDQQLRRETLQQLIDRQLLLGYAQDAGLRVADQDVANALRRQSVFQVDGEFSVERYRSLLSQNNITPEQYEAQLRRDLALEALRDAVVGTAITSDAEIERLVALQRQERRAGWLSVSAAAFEDEVSVDDAAVQEYYEANRDDYRRPEAVRLRYVLLDPQRLAADIEVDEDTLRERYEERVAQAERGAPRRIRHILVEVPESADEAAVAEAREEAQALRERIQGGESFAQVAEDASDDPGSARQGGDLGLVRQGDFVEPFEEAAWSLEEGELSEPVRTEFGWHLIEVTEVRSADVPAFEELRDELRAEVARERAERRLYELGNELETLAFENPDSLQPAAETLGIEVQETDWITPEGGGEGIAAEPAVLEAAFSEERIGERVNSDLLELEGNRYAVIRVADHRDAAVEPLDEVRDRVEAAVREARAADAARERAEALQQRLADGEAFEAVAGEASEGVSAQSPRWIRRDSGEVPAAVREQAFRLAVAGDEQAAELARLDGGWAVVMVDAVRPGDVSDLGDEERAQLRSTLDRLDGNAAFEALVAALREEADISIREDRL
ncbi:SurA N-terminal domain-containing protein [Spiribacter halobius]|uniref:Periplasmic chaperone PpiD n=1 Tax=Sediminicurvatus halobius TaxID=2182432 RepID=A0A2U2MX78_9GAMM|nr:SurA N-terminal domain-containing protein [Spiribacter halobius]PWG61432.1 peptidylprolyl isomerase [Spiribacter halobius]UEX76944.1 SurA N-terminal domain-containing protein [Spiribacter halobius]